MDYLSDIENVDSDFENLSNDDISLNSSLTNIDYLAMFGLSHEDTIRSQQTTYCQNGEYSSLGSSFFSLDLGDSILSE